MYEQLKTVECEMSTRQRGLVDACLEEGQFESAIVILDQLRSSAYKPPSSLICQIIYIALHPVNASHNNKPRESSDFPPTPQPIKQHSPSGTAVLLSHRLLLSFAATNSPEALARALPHCDDPNKHDPLLEGDFGDSVIGKEAASILKARDCWNILTEEFTQQGQSLLAPLKNKKRARAFEIDATEGFQNEKRAVVCENSWPVLDWLLVLFERDEIQTEALGLGQYSPQILRQIPCPSNGTSTRWDTEAPLRVVFYCLEQTESRRRMMGSRLMTLLINLSSTVHLDFNMFVASVFRRLSASSPENISMLFFGLSRSSAVHRFKVALCQKFLINPTGDFFTQVGQRPRVPTRAQPRAFRPPHVAESLRESTTPSTTPPSRPTMVPLPSCGEFRHLMETNVSTASSGSVTGSLLLRIKFELMISYGTLQFEALSDKDPEWLDLLQYLKQTETLDLMFGPDGEDSLLYKKTLKNLISTWWR